LVPKLLLRRRTVGIARRGLQSMAALLRPIALPPPSIYSRTSVYCTLTSHHATIECGATGGLTRRGIGAPQGELLAGLPIARGRATGFSAGGGSYRSAPKLSGWPARVVVRCRGSLVPCARRSSKANPVRGRKKSPIVPGFSPDRVEPSAAMLLPGDRTGKENGRRRPGRVQAPILERGRPARLSAPLSVPRAKAGGTPALQKAFAHPPGRPGQEKRLRVARGPREVPAGRTFLTCAPWSPARGQKSRTDAPNRKAARGGRPVWARPPGSGRTI
jgi:hypothetical protein